MDNETKDFDAQKISGIYVSIPGPGSQQVANGIQQMTTGL
jgi:hypothetical protein